MYKRQVVGWVDLFSRKACRDILINNLKYCIEHKGLLLYAYVIMTNHVHAIMAAEQDTKGLSFLIRDFKSYSSKQLSTWILSDLSLIHIYQTEGKQEPVWIQRVIPAK